MALDGTYSGLKASIAAWLNRDDLTELIPDLITLAEARLNDRLRVREMEKSIGLALTDGGLNLPSDFLEARIVVGMQTDDQYAGLIITDDIDSGGLPISDEETDALWRNEIGAIGAAGTSARVLRLGDPGWGIETHAGDTGCLPEMYTIIGSSLTVYPAGASVVAMTYYAKIPPLSDEHPSNWLLTKRPQIYLYASLLESAPMLGDDGRVMLWKAALDQAISDFEVSDMGARWSNATMQLSGPTI